MAITYRGFATAALQFSEVDWAKYQKRTAGSYDGMRVWSGGDVTPGTGRAVNVSATDGVLPGIWYVSDTVTSVAIAANAGSARRIDYIVAEANWTTRTVSFAAVAGVAGTNPTAPALTQNEGVLFRMPLARVSVAGNATTIAAGDIEPCKPTRQKANRYVTAVNSDTMNIAATDWNSLGFVDVIDPGWPYMLHIDSLVRFAATEGAGTMRIRALDVTNANDLAHGITPNLQVNNAGRSAAVMNRTSGVLTGARRIRLEMFPAEFGAGAEQIQVLPFSGNHFTVTQIPA